MPKKETKPKALAEAGKETIKKEKFKGIQWKEIERNKKWEAENEYGWRLIVRSVGAKENLIFGAHNAHGNYSCYLGSEKTLEEAKKLAESGERKESPGLDTTKINLADLIEKGENKPKTVYSPPSMEKKTRAPRASANSPGKSQSIEILSKTNPYIQGSKRHGQFELVLEAKTVGDFTKAGGLMRELGVFMERKLIKVDDPS